MRICRAEPEDLEELQAADAICFPDDARPHFEGGAWWCVWEGDLLAGYCGAQPSSQWGNAVYLNRAGVLPWARGLRLQRRMLQTRERWARSRDADWSLTDCVLGNVKSCNSLISAGYRTFQPSRPWGLTEAIYWRKDLRPRRRADRTPASSNLILCAPHI